ncbi:MAG: putative lipopolysaccharide heptosyltransferase III [Nitrospirota bacterium]
MDKAKLENVKRILVIKLRHIGDVLMMTPALRALKDAMPEAEITAVVPFGMEDILASNPSIDEILTFRKGSGLMKDLILLKSLRDKKFDIAINMTEGDRGAIMCLVSGARIKIGADPTKKGFLGKNRIFTSIVPQIWDKHRALMDLEMVRPLGISPAGQKLELYTSKKDDEYVRGLLADRGVKENEPIATVHPTSRWPFKCWNDKSIAEVIDYLQANGLRVIMTSAPDKEEAGKVIDIANLATARPINLSGLLTLGQLASLIKMSRLSFGVDSAPMHIAAAVGTPVVALFGPSDYRVWAPFTDKARVVMKKDMFPCLPCQKAGCGGSKKSDCLEAITVQEVISAIEELLGTQ